MSVPTWARRDLTATLHVQGPLVIVEIPGMREVDTPRVLELLRGMVLSRSTSSSA